MHDLHLTDLRSRLRAARRHRTRIGVAYYLGHSAEMLSRLMITGPDVRAELTRAYRGALSAYRAGHWTADWNRVEGLRQALVAERAVAIAVRREMRRAA